MARRQDQTSSASFSNTSGNTENSSISRFQLDNSITCALKLYIIGLQNCLIANALGWSFYIHYIPRIEQVY